jgi:hypothetical protein
MTVRHRIADAAEGNPFFIEEMFDADRRWSRREAWRSWIPTKNLSQVTVPPTISALLAARLDRLSPTSERCSEAASVAVRNSSSAPFRARTRGSLDRGPGALEVTCAKEFVRPDRSTLLGEDAFRFRHLLIRDAAYEAMPKGSAPSNTSASQRWLEGVAETASKSRRRSWLSPGVGA